MHSQENQYGARANTGTVLCAHYETKLDFSSEKLHAHRRET